MPAIKAQRQDVMRPAELENMLRRLDGKEEITGEYATHIRGKLVTQTFKIDCAMAQCILAMLWIFGKRITEVVRLKRRDIWSDGLFLYARFTVLKKKKKAVIPITYVKRIRADHPYAHYVLDFVAKIGDKEAYVFPGETRKRKIRVKMPKKTYEYATSDAGHISSNKVWKIVKFLDSLAWCHLFRHSVATIMAEEGATESELMSWFDWTDPKVAHGYVSRGPKLTERLSERNW